MIIWYRAQIFLSVFMLLGFFLFCGNKWCSQKQRYGKSIDWNLLCGHGFCIKVSQKLIQLHFYVSESPRMSSEALEVWPWNHKICKICTESSACEIVVKQPLTLQIRLGTKILQCLCGSKYCIRTILKLLFSKAGPCWWFFTFVLHIISHLKPQFTVVGTMHVVFVYTYPWIMNASNKYFFG